MVLIDKNTTDSEDIFQLAVEEIKELDRDQRIASFGNHDLLSERRLAKEVARNRLTKREEWVKRKREEQQKHRELTSRLVSIAGEGIIPRKRDIGHESYIESIASKLASLHEKRQAAEQEEVSDATAKVVPAEIISETVVKGDADSLYQESLRKRFPGGKVSIKSLDPDSSVVTSQELIDSQASPQSEIGQHANFLDNLKSRLGVDEHGRLPRKGRGGEIFEELQSGSLNTGTDEIDQSVSERTENNLGAIPLADRTPAKIAVPVDEPAAVQKSDSAAQDSAFDAIADIEKNSSEISSNLADTTIRDSSGAVISIDNVGDSPAEIQSKVEPAKADDIEFTIDSTSPVPTTPVLNPVDNSASSVTTDPIIETTVSPVNDSIGMTVIAPDLKGADEVIPATANVTPVVEAAVDEVSTQPQVVALKEPVDNSVASSEIQKVTTQPIEVPSSDEIVAENVDKSKESIADVADPVSVVVDEATVVRNASPENTNTMDTGESNFFKSFRDLFGQVPDNPDANSVAGLAKSAAGRSVKEELPKAA